MGVLIDSDSKRGKTIPPYKYKGPWPIESDQHPIEPIQFILSFSFIPFALIPFSNLNCFSFLISTTKDKPPAIYALTGSLPSVGDDEGLNGVVPRLGFPSACPSGTQIGTSDREGQNF